MSKYSKAEREEAIKMLREELKPGDTVHTILRHVSKSGMTRHIDLVLIRNNDTRYLTWLAAKAMDYRSKGNGDGLVVSGCGMDMGFHIVYNLGYTLWPKGFECAGESCRSNDHTNGDRNYKPHQHKDGGYALNHRWI